MSCRVDYHGSSGRWQLQDKEIDTLDSAVRIARKVKASGYGVRIVDEQEGAVVMEAPWQELVWHPENEERPAKVEAFRLEGQG